MKNKKITIKHVYIDYLENPLGLDNSSPTISWKLMGEDGSKDIRQKA